MCNQAPRKGPFCIWRRLPELKHMRWRRASMVLPSQYGVVLPDLCGMSAIPVTNCLANPPEAHMNSVLIVKLEKTFRRSFWCAAAAVVVMTAYYLSGGSMAASGAQLAFLASLAAGLIFCVSLGKLARCTNRSWVTWVGLSIITYPIGPVVAYAAMTSILSQRSEPSL
jgi:hypothetical protein